MSRLRTADAEVIGTPRLDISDEDRGAVQDLVAELLLEAVERDDEASRT